MNKYIYAIFSGMLAPDGTCRSFDAKGSGYVRSEAAVTVLLQRRPDSKRIYCTIVHCRNNCDGFKDKGKCLSG